MFRFFCNVMKREGKAHIYSEYRIKQGLGPFFLLTECLVTHTGVFPTLRWGIVWSSSYFWCCVLFCFVLFRSSGLFVVVVIFPLLYSPPHPSWAVAVKNPWDWNSLPVSVNVTGLWLDVNHGFNFNFLARGPCNRKCFLPRITLPVCSLPRTKHIFFPDWARRKKEGPNRKACTSIQMALDLLEAHTVNGAENHRGLGK